MIPGPYQICLCHFPSGESETPDLKTLSYGYDTAVSAYDAIPQISMQHNVKPEDCVVIRPIDREEAQNFIS